MKLGNVVKQKWFMPTALGVVGLSFILFLKKQGTDSNVQTYDSYSSVPGEKAEAITQGMYDMEERLKAGQLSYLDQINGSLSAVTDQIKDIELTMKNPAVYEQPTAQTGSIDLSPVTTAINNLAGVINQPAPNPNVRNVQVGYARTTIQDLAKDIGVNQNTLLQLNPGLTSNSKIGGAFLNLPVPASTPAPAPAPEVRSVAVGNARTWDNLAKDLGVSKASLIALNPGLNANSKIGGKTINLPKK